MTRLALLALLGCAHPSTPTRPPTPASPLIGWWEVDYTDDAGVLKGNAIRVDADQTASVVEPSIPAVELCTATITGSQLVLSGCEQATTAKLVDDHLELAGVTATRAPAERAAALDQLVVAIHATCDRARACYEAAQVGGRSPFGPFLRRDACENILANVSSDLREAGKPVPAACGS